MVKPFRIKKGLFKKTCQNHCTRTFYNKFILSIIGTDLCIFEINTIFCLIRQ